MCSSKIDFSKGNKVPLGTPPKRATRSLIQEKDPVVKANPIESIGRQLNKGRTPTVAQTTKLIQNTRDGKDNRGRLPTIEGRKSERENF